MKMAKKKLKPAEIKNVNITALLWLGLILVGISATLHSLFPKLPEGITTMLYVFGIIALVIYMWQIMYEKRTGRSESGGEPKNKLSGKK